MEKEANGHPLLLPLVRTVPLACVGDGDDIQIDHLPRTDIVPLAKSIYWEPIDGLLGKSPTESRPGREGQAEIEREFHHL